MFLTLDLFLVTLLYWSILCYFLLLIVFIILICLLTIFSIALFSILLFDVYDILSSLISWSFVTFKSDLELIFIFILIILIQFLVRFVLNTKCMYEKMMINLKTRAHGFLDGIGGLMMVKFTNNSIHSWKDVILWLQQREKRQNFHVSLSYWYLLCL